MDMSYCSPLQFQEDASSLLFDCEALLDKSCAYDPFSDPGYFSASSSRSPTSSVDSFSFSPSQVKTEQDPLDCFVFSAPQQTTTQIQPASTTTPFLKKSRAKYPGKKRQTASEREKLRMRDLTKAMHHLRSYLPASVAPAGQTLTKIETLTLTIRYISHLSAQLGLTDEVHEQRKFMEQSSAQTLNQQPLINYSPLQETQCTSNMQPVYTTAPLEAPTGLCYTPEQYWMAQQQFSHMGFTGHC